MRTIETAVDIDAPPDAVWAVIADLAAYREWNPFLVSAEGELQPGARLRITFKSGDRRPVTMRPTVTHVETGRRLCWQGRLLLPHLFDGAHELVVEPVDGARARFVQREEFGGLLVPLLGRLLRDTAAAFEVMNQALKARVEAQARTRP